LQLSGSLRDEVSLTVKSPLKELTVDRLKDIVLEKRVLVDLPSNTQKQHLITFLRSADGIETRLQARALVGDVYASDKTFVFQLDNGTVVMAEKQHACLESVATPEKVNAEDRTAQAVQAQDVKPLLAGVANFTTEGAQAKSRKPFQNPCSHPCVKQLCKHLCCKVGLEELSEEIQELLRRRRNRIVGIPCTHNCHNKTKCGHKCCKDKASINDGWSPEGGEVKDDRPPSPSRELHKPEAITESRKRKLEEDVYEEYLFQQAKLELNDPELGGEVRKSKRRRKDNTPCRHQCLNKRSCKHSCCKVGIDAPYTTITMELSDSTEESEEAKPAILAPIVKAAEVIRPEAITKETG